MVFAPLATTIWFSAFASTETAAHAVGSGPRRIFLIFTPAPSSAVSAISPNSSLPARPTMLMDRSLLGRARAAATAWFSPLPPAALK